MFEFWLAANGFIKRCAVCKHYLGRWNAMSLLQHLAMVRMKFYHSCQLARAFPGPVCKQTKIWCHAALSSVSVAAIVTS